MKFRLLILLFFSWLLSSCSLDFSGLFYSSADVDERFNDQQSEPAVSAFSTTGLPFSFVVISDIHIKNGQNDNFLKLKNKLTTTDLALFAAGDLTQNGDYSDEVLCKEGMVSVGLPYYAMLGNHDLFYGGWKKYKSVFGRSCYTFSSGPVRFIVLDTASGSIGKNQKTWLEGILASRTEPYCIVLSHMNIVSFPGSGNSQLTDNEEIAYLMHLFEARAVNYYICGHVHKQDDTAVNGVRYLCVEDFKSKLTYLRVTVTSTGLSYQFY